MYLRKRKRIFPAPVCTSALQHPAVVRRLVTSGFVSKFVYRKFSDMEYSEDAKQVQKVSEYVVAYDFEVYDIIGTITWFREYRIIMYATIGIYLLSVYFGQKWMKTRPAFKLAVPLFLWNLGLAFFSIICTLRGMPEFLFLLKKPHGLYLATCVGLPHNYATSFWGLAMVLSKFVELGDTAFIILRKQKLIALHWFHHAGALMIFWIGYEYYETAGRGFFVNTFVHSFMYFYYALKARGVKIPKSVSQALTTLQIMQLAYGVYGALSILYYWVRGRPCRMHFETVCLGGMVVGMFLVLFVRFYRQSYLSREKSKEN
ncbi:unnamed protein product [Allacma fusca]|uniref:Elongation of very long chain fatty acids protein n=1 Tax=Allacma fusca TaxID=39272 RepID=A0A8J2PGT6_9HEXA|nr:unnamed protein product [Allacma fusca]